jgi:hypothetical protein
MGVPARYGAVAKNRCFYCILPTLFECINKLIILNCLNYTVMINMPPNQPSQEPMIITYATLRKVIGFLAFFLAPVLVGGSLIFDHPAEIRTSISAYYYSSMRNEMEGIICGIAMFLLSYDGYTKQDSIISKLAGLFALGIAFFPTSDTDVKDDIISQLHYIYAGIFFALLAYMCVFLFTKTSGNMTVQKKQRNRVYRVCGIIMAFSVLCIPFDGITAIHNKISFLEPTLVLEILALVSFGISWLTKGEFILKDKPASNPVA